MITASRVAADPLFEGTAQDGVFRSPDPQVPSAVLYNMEACFILRSSLKLCAESWLCEMLVVVRCSLGQAVGAGY